MRPASTRPPVMRLGIADHFGWAVAITASADYEVVDRRRIELVEPGVTAAPIHYDSAKLTVDATAALVAEVRASVARATAAAFDELPESITSMSLREWPDDFPTDIEVQMRSPWEARADAVMYRQILAEFAERRGWAVHVSNARDVLGQAAKILGARTDEVLEGPRARLGAPWTKDHRVALAATIVNA